MHNLRHSYNRRYYYNVSKIWIRAYWKSFRLHIAHQIIKFAFVISPDAKNAIESRMLKHPRSRYHIIPR